MTNDNFTYKPQDVNYLGFLEAQLRDLQGIATLAYELIQNADDAPPDAGSPPATAGSLPINRLTFDVTDDALLVENDGLFRPVDFARLQNIASGGKREEAGTIGAFGLGFIAVYQVTDAPEIYASGRHWRLNPAAPPDQRIQERRLPTTGTRFRLPWAFDPASPIRRTLRLPAIRPGQLDEFAASLAAAIETAALFLRQLTRLEVKRNGRLLRHIERQSGPGRELILRDNNGQTQHWLRFQGDFNAAAAALRAAHPWQIETARHSDVQLAIPTDPSSRPGRLYAGLPTATTLPLPLHINADFFPTTDRKRIHFAGEQSAGGYQAAWNQAAMTAAAQLLAHNLGGLPGRVGHMGLWQLLQKAAETAQMANQGDLPQIFAAFWQALQPLLPTLPLLYTANGQWQPAAEVRLLPRPGAIPLLASLNIPVPHPDLAPFAPLLRRPEFGASELTIADVAAGLLRHGLTGTLSLAAAPPPWPQPNTWQILWSLLDTLYNRLPRPGDRDTARQQLRPCALLLTERLTLVPPGRVYRGADEARSLFPDVAWLHDSVPTDSFPGREVPHFNARAAVERLAQTPAGQLTTAWQLGQLDLPRLFRWFEAQQIEILVDDPGLAAAIRRLPLCPVAGELRPLANLYIAGGFEDPLQLAGVVDLAAIGGRREFLLDLGVPTLDFDTYLYDVLPGILAHNPDLPSDARHRLVQLLAGRLGEFRDDALLQAQLRDLPLIACLDGTFRAAAQAYATRDVLALLGDGVPIAEPVTSQAVAALHRWLGVRPRPGAADLVQALLTIAQTWSAAGRPPDAPTQARLRHCWQRLSELHQEEALPAGILAPLAAAPVLLDRRQRLARPGELLIADDPSLAAQFPTLADHLLPPDAALDPLLRQVGVRPLSQAAVLHVPGAAAATPDTPLQVRITARRPLIERLRQAEPAPGRATGQLDFLDRLQVRRLPGLQTVYRLALGHTMVTTRPEPAAARLETATATLYVAEGPPSWPAIARELALAIRPDRSAGGLALGLKEVLAAPSPAAAARLLDELGYP